MTLRGGYDIVLAGKPGQAILQLPDPKILRLPVKTRRFSFTDLAVKDGDVVSQGDTLARDPENFAVPLLAGRGGKVQYSEGDEFIVLKDLAAAGHEPPHAEEPPHIATEMGAGGIKRYKLLSLGAWEYFEDARTGALPDPLGTPSAVIVSTLSLEPFLARGDIQLQNKLLNFTRGLEQLQSLLEYQPIYLVMPDIKSAFATQVREQLRGYAWAKQVEIAPKYPHDNFTILARHLRLKRDSGPIWAIRTEGVLAVDQALTAGKACVTRVISFAGPAVTKPCHIEALPGHSLRDIAAHFALPRDARLIEGGALTGTTVDLDSKRSLDPACRGLTGVIEQRDREFLGFVRPGLDRKSYAKCFLSVLRGKFEEKMTTGTRGEPRPCIACNFCEEACPAGILPYLIHKYLYGDLIEEVEQARVDLCVECGLCSFICPCKIELMKQFAEAKAQIAQEKAEAAAEVAAAAAAEAAAAEAAAAAQAAGQES